MVKPEINRVDESQISLIIKLAKEIWLPTFQPFFSPLELQSLFQGMYSPENLSEWFAKVENQMFIIGEKNSPIGYFAVAFKQNKFWLDKIYIHPSMQGSGMGYKTWQIVKEMAKAKGHKNIWLRVNRRNQTAINFYQKVGFKISASVDFEGPNGFVYDDYLMDFPIL